MDMDPIDRKEIYPSTIRVGGFNYRAISREIAHCYPPTSAIMAPLLVQSIINKYFEDTRSGWFKYRVISREFIHGYLHTSAVMATLFVESIVKKRFVDTRYGWLNLSCHIAGVYSRLSPHFCSYGNFVGPIDRKEVPRGLSLWMVEFIVSYRGSLFTIISTLLQLWQLCWSNRS